MEITIYSVYFRNHDFIIDKATADTVKPESLTTWIFKTKEHTGSTALELAKRMAASNAFNASTGMGDQPSIIATRGQFLIQILTESAVKMVGDAPNLLGNPIEVPVDIAREFNNQVEGSFLLQSELDSVKK